MILVREAADGVDGGGEGGRSNGPYLVRALEVKKYFFCVFPLLK